MIRRTKIKSDQVGLLFNDGQFQKIVGEGTHWFFDPWGKTKIEAVELRSPVFQHSRLRDVVKREDLKGLGEVLDLRDWQRALIWIDGRFFAILTGDLYIIWSVMAEVRIEVVDARIVQFEHQEMPVISRSCDSDQLNIVSVERDHAGVLFVDGRYQSTLQPGRYVFWRNVAEVIVAQVDLREQAIDVNGQDLMTADKVSLRLNAVVTYRIVDPGLAISSSENVGQALYRASQLALRAIVGQHELDEFLDDKEQLGERAMSQLRVRANELGLAIVSVGVRDVILPGDMKNLMNKVIEARKAAEANLISRREETAAMRSQANTAKLLDAHPTLMRLRELEVLETISQSSNLQVILGEKEGLTNRIRRLV